ncbi:MAG: hypothetical protein ABIH35_00835 [Patescibacteria group bacterium]
MKSGNVKSNTGIGPQPKSGSAFSRRMRFHQSWYRDNVLSVPYGTGPKKNDTRELGNMLDKESGNKGLNFLTPQIFDIAKRRMEAKTGVVEPYRLLHNMLSSQPMCFNLFGPLVDDKEFATNVFKTILPNEVEKIIEIAFEYAPDHANEYLDDRTAFDAFVKFKRPDGKGIGFIGIETKLTEPFSQVHYDSDIYRKWTERPDSPWPPNAWEKLSEIGHNQLWRDHLLAVAMTFHEHSPYACGFFMLVRHPEDKNCTKVTKEYKKLLKSKDESFLDYPLDELIGVMESISQKDWLTEFKRRYLELPLSEKDWKNQTG